MNIVVLGKGVFGTAIGSLISENKKDFDFVDIDLPLTKQSDLVFITVPTQHIRQALQTSEHFFTNKTIFINCAKGIEKETAYLPHQIVAEVMHPNHYFALMGPSYANDLFQKQPTLLSLGYSDEAYIRDIKDLLQTSYCRIEIHKGYEALELASALKNIYAIVCGFASGLEYDANTLSLLTIMALREYELMARAMKFSLHSIVIPAVTGDFILTCTFPKSRNFQFGHNLASMDAELALSEVGSTVEGYQTLQVVEKLCEQYTITLPLITLARTIVDKGSQAKPDFLSYIASI
jgi:glycerol-3-phosphate dehydrogenase (NAD(P)+)